MVVSSVNILVPIDRYFTKINFKKKDILKISRLFVIDFFFLNFFFYKNGIDDWRKWWMIS